MTLSVKPEIVNIPQRSQRRSKLRP